MLEYMGHRLQRVGPQVVVLAIGAASVLLAVWKEAILPDKYFADGRRLQQMIADHQTDIDDPFARVAWLYTQLGPLLSQQVVELTTFALAIVLVLVCHPWERMRHLQLGDTATLCFALVMAAVYLAQYTKESLVLLVVLFVIAGPSSPIAFVLRLGAMAALAQWIRPYWWMTLAAYVVLLVVLPRIRSLLTLVLPVLACYLGAAFTCQAVKGVDLTGFRAFVNDGRLMSDDAQSKIIELLPGHGPVVAAANAAIDTVGLVVPFPLLRHGSAMYLAIGVVVGVLWITALRRLGRACRAGAFAEDPRLLRAASLLIAVVAVLGIFEPDYGSYLKHMAPLLPLFLLVADRTRDLPVRAGDRAARTPGLRPVPA